MIRGISQEQNRVFYIIAGSSISMMEDIVKSSRQPFFAQFRIERLGPFTREDTFGFAKRILLQGSYIEILVGQDKFRSRC